MANRWFTQFFYTLHKKPTLLDCNFVVDAANGNGLGIRSLKGPGIARVFMNSTAAFTGTSHTSVLIDGISGGTASLLPGMPVQGSGIAAGTTIASIVSSGSINLSAATSSSTTGSVTYQGVGSPNPAAGLIYVQFTDNYSRYYGGFSGFNSPIVNPTTAVTSGLTLGAAYVITSLGTTTTAEWQIIGVPPGTVPAVGIGFIAIATGTGGAHTGKVGTPSASGVVSIEAIGDSNQMIVTTGAEVLGGRSASSPYLLFQCLAPTITGGTSAFEAPMIPTAPAANSVVGLAFYLSNSYIQAAGE